MVLSAVGLIASMSACVSTGAPAGASADEKAVAKGVKAWNDRNPQAAKAPWSGIDDKALKDKYLGYLSAYESGAKTLEDALLFKETETAKISASYDKAYGYLSKLPKDLEIPRKDKDRALAMAETRVRTHMASGNMSAAKTSADGARKLFGDSAALAALVKEIDLVLASRKREAEADSALDKGRATEDFDGRIALFDAAIKDYGKAESTLSSDASKLGLGKSPYVAAENSRLKKKRQDATIERERLLRERAYYYKDRAGEEFARAPVGKKPGTLTLEELLAHHETVKANISKVYDEMKAFSAKYPGAIDEDAMAELEAYKRDLDANIAKVVAEIKTAKEIASRGKVVMPVMIGLFNPEPGSTEEAKKSRPALFSATGVTKNDYWWGMVSIPRGVMNDLVITVSDGRTVRVFPANTVSGSLIAKNKIPDLVNRGYKVGNSWPVLNAGSQLPTDKYFFEIQPGKTGDYSGEVVVYSSFITRSR